MEETDTPSLEEQAQEEGVVNIVAAISNSAPFFKQDMADEVGITANFQFKDFGKTSTQMVQEYQANKVSIDMSGSATTGDPLTLLQLADNEVVREIPSDIFESDEYSAKPIVDGRAAHVGYGKALTMLYNKENVDNPPTTLDELFSEQWKGKVGVDVRDSEFVPAARKVFDSEDRVEQYISNLGEWATPFSSHFDMGKAIARGEIPMGLTYVKYANYEWGGPLAEADIEDMPTTAGISTLWLTNKAPHPAAAEMALRYSVRDANWVNYYKDVAGDNVYFTHQEVEEGEFDPDKNFIAFPSTMQDLDPEQIEQDWHDWTGFAE
jgi:ABC-type Fe3+ transport system substrate-binding protein